MPALTIAYWSVAALAVVILASCVTRVNAGVLAIALAWITGAAAGLKTSEIVAGFPSSLFLTLAGTMLVFTQARENGVLERIAERAINLCRGNTGLVPVLFFVLAATLASIGPGNIATAALLAPMAMQSAHRAGIPPFLMAIMVGNGANAGSLSPLAPTGIIVNDIMARIGLAGLEPRTFLNNLGAHALVAFSGYLLFGGWRLFRRQGDGSLAAPKPFEARHTKALAVLAVLLLAVLWFRLPIGFAAFTAALVMAALDLAPVDEALRKMPWGVIVLVCGVTVLVALLEKTQGVALMTAGLARISSPVTVTAAAAFVVGLISVYSSTSGVVLPAFLPTVPGLAAALPGSSAVAIASAMNVGSHLVDVSPLSTIGALCLASLPAGEDPRTLFNRLLIWGLAMCVAGALVSFLLFR